MQYNFLVQYFVVSKRILFSRSCKFSVFYRCYLFTTVHCQSASSASHVLAVFDNRERNPQLSQVFLDLELFLLCSSRNCGMPAAPFHQLSYTYQLGQWFCFLISQWSCESLDHESKAKPNHFIKIQLFVKTHPNKTTSQFSRYEAIESQNWST